MSNVKKLYKNKSKAIISGVCAGIAEYFEIDSTLIRLIWVAFMLLGGSGVLLYIIAAIILPEKRNVIGFDDNIHLNVDPNYNSNTNNNCNNNMYEKSNSYANNTNDKMYNDGDASAYEKKDDHVEF